MSNFPLGTRKLLEGDLKQNLGYILGDVDGVVFFARGVAGSGGGGGNYS